MKNIPMAMLVVALIAITVIERKNARAVQAKARRILYPGDTQEMANILAELRSYRDSESQTLAGQLQEAPVQVWEWRWVPLWHFGDQIRSV